MLNVNVGWNSTPRFPREHFCLLCTLFCAKNTRIASRDWSRLIFNVNSTPRSPNSFSNSHLSLLLHPMRNTIRTIDSLPAPVFTKHPRSLKVSSLSLSTYLNVLLHESFPFAISPCFDHPLRCPCMQETAPTPFARQNVKSAMVFPPRSRQRRKIVCVLISRV